MAQRSEERKSMETRTNGDTRRRTGKRTGIGAGLLLAAGLLAAGAASGQEPKRSAAWETYCTACHGPDGKAQTEEGKRKGARNLADPRWQATVSDMRLESSIARGRDKMPSFGKKLTEAQVKALVAEVRALSAK
jgi:mono/diheme cytochrome c family protein